MLLLVVEAALGVEGEGWEADGVAGIETLGASREISSKLGTFTFCNEN